MYKRLEFHYGDDNGVEMELIHPGVLVKTAEVSSDLTEFIKALKTEDGKVYILVNALSAGEYYGSNRNGDYIAEEILRRYHKDFEVRGRVYKHHKNKDPKTSLGKVLFSSYNGNMHRVELVCELDENKDERFIQRIQRGEYPSVSMGMRTPYDICSICGHKSKNLTQYCDHLRNEMNHTYPDGRKVMAVNPAAKFFDISFVIIGADPTAGVMRKLASGAPEISRPSAEIGEEFLRVAGLKEADLIKQVESPAEIREITKDVNGNIFLSQPNIPVAEIKRITKTASVGEIFSTLMGMRIVPTPMDFQNIILHSQGQEKLAEDLASKNELIFKVTKDTQPLITEDVTLANFNDPMAKKLAHLIPDRSLTKQLVTARILEKTALFRDGYGSRMEQEGAFPPPKNPLADPDKEAGEFYIKKEPSYIQRALLGTSDEEKYLLPDKNPLLASTALGSLFYGIQKVNQVLDGPQSVGKYDAFLLRRPWLIPLLIGATSYAAVKGQEAMRKNAEFSASNVLTRYLLTVPATYMYAGAQEAKVRKGEQIGAIQNLIRKHPFLSSVGVGMGLGAAQKALMKMSSLNQGDVLRRAIFNLSDDRLEELFKDVTHL